MDCTGLLALAVVGAVAWPGRRRSADQGQADEPRATDPVDGVALGWVAPGESSRTAR